MHEPSGRHSPSDILKSSDEDEERISRIRTGLTTHQAFVTFVLGTWICNLLNVQVIGIVFALLMFGSTLLVLPRFPIVRKVLGASSPMTLSSPARWLLLVGISALVLFNFVVLRLIDPIVTAPPDFGALPSNAVSFIAAAIGLGHTIFVIFRFFPAARVARSLCLTGIVAFGGGLIAAWMEAAVVGSTAYYVELDGALAWVCTACGAKAGTYSTNVAGILRYLGALFYILGLGTMLVQSLPKNSRAAVRDSLARSQT